MLLIQLFHCNTVLIDFVGQGEIETLLKEYVEEEKDSQANFLYMFHPKNLELLEKNLNLKKNRKNQ
jgi:hypothetical protein